MKGIDLGDIDPSQADIYGYSWGKLKDRFTACEDKVFIINEVLEDYVIPHMVDVNDHSLVCVRTISDLIVQYRKDTDDKFSILHGMMEFKDTGTPLTDRLVELFQTKTLAPQLTRRAHGYEHTFKS